MPRPRASRRTPRVTTRVPYRLRSTRPRLLTNHIRSLACVAASTLDDEVAAVAPTLGAGKAIGPCTVVALPAASSTSSSTPCGPGLSFAASTAAWRSGTLSGHGTGTRNENASPPGAGAHVVPGATGVVATGAP